MHPTQLASSSVFLKLLTNYNGNNSSKCWDHSTGARAPGSLSWAEAGAGAEKHLLLDPMCAATAHSQVMPGKDNAMLFV